VAGKPVPVSWQQLPRRVDAAQQNNGGYDLEVSGLPWGRSACTVERYRYDATHDIALLDSSGGRGATIRLRSELPEPGAELIVIRKAAAR
jgi:hypothetical protein